MLEPNFVRSIRPTLFPMIEGPNGNLIANSIDMFHQFFPRNCSISISKFWKISEIHALGASIYLVTTRDVSSFALVTSDSFPVKSTSVLFWSTQCELCKFCTTQCGVEQLLPSTACTARELSGTPGACCFFLCCQFILVTRL